MELIILVFLFVGTLVYNYFTTLRRDQAERERFREFVIANKSENLNQYVEAIPNDVELEKQSEDEIIDLDQLSPEELLSIRQKELK